MRQAIAALTLVVCVFAGCTSSHTNWPSCTLEGGVDGGPSLCPGTLSCASFFLPVADGTCQGIGSVCMNHCTTNADCAVLGANTICSSACVAENGGPVCTPYQ
jgi:hypothetical protein